MRCATKVYVFLGKWAVRILVPLQPIPPFIILIKEIKTAGEVRGGGGDMASRTLQHVCDLHFYSYSSPTPTSYFYFDCDAMFENTLCGASRIFLVKNFRNGQAKFDMKTLPVLVEIGSVLLACLLRS